MACGVRCEAISRSAKGGGGTVPRWPFSPDCTPTCEEGSLRIRLPPPTGSGISPVERRKGSRASAGQSDAGPLCDTQAVLQ